MSRIYFHEIDQEVGVSGGERRLGARLCTNFAVSTLDTTPELADAYYRDVLDEGWFKLGFHRSVSEALETYFLLDRGRRIRLNGETTDPFAVSLNTALRLGSDPVKLLARLHGQCEIHAWVDGPNRAWLANIIRQGLASRLYGAGRGWEEVIELLETLADQPVVTSYSVCDSFPNEVVAEWTGSNDEWYALTESERWERAVAGLRQKCANRHYSLELRPDNWNDFYFDLNISALDIRAAGEAAHLKKAR